MSTSRLSSTELKFLLVLAAIQFNHIVDFMLMMPLGPQLMRLLNISTTQFGALVSSYTFSAAASGFLCSFFMDRYDRKNLLLFLSIGFSIGTALCGLTETYWTLFIARSVAGAFGGVLGAVVLAIVSDGIAYNKRGVAMGIMATSFSVASVFGVPMSLFIAQKFGWNWSFLILSVIAMLLVALVYFYVPQQSKHIRKRASPLEPLKHIYQNSYLGITLLFAAMVVLGQFIIIPFLSPSLVANEALLEEQLPYVYFFGGLVTLVTGPLIGKMADLYGKPKMFAWGVLFAGISVLLVTNITKVPLWYTLVVSTFFFICTNARWIPAQAMITGAVAPEFRGSFMSYVSVVQHLMAGLGATISGMIVYQSTEGRIVNYEIVGFISIGVSLFAFVLSRRIRVIEDKTETPS